jgi:serine/threonine-protein kinase
MAQICAGVEAAHHYRLIHRDLKPANVLLADVAGGKKAAKILDFGIARGMEKHRTKLTAPNMALGTPSFISPEQLRGGTADERSDIYALGALLYYVVAGREPYRGDNPQSVFYQQLKKDPDKLNFKKLNKPRALEAVILKAMHRERAKRYQSCAELMNGLYEAAGMKGTRWSTGYARVGPASKSRLLLYACIGIAVVAAILAAIFLFGKG